MIAFDSYQFQLFCSRIVRANKPGAKRQRSCLKRISLVALDQLAIAATGVTAVWLSQDNREDWRSYACLFGMASQPFWFYATWKAGQWGIFALSFLYAASWARGFYYQWVRA